jgi:serine/threonine protein kinase
VLIEHIYQGKRIDNYRILAEISSGTTSSVYLAEHPHYPQNSLVMKLFHIGRISKQQCELFLQEVQLLKKIKHAHILPILDAGIFEDMPYYVTDYAIKGSLRNLLDSQSPRLLPIQESLAILRVVGQTLQFTHQMNILHGNLKPENILFDNTGVVLLTDFSIVTLQDTLNTEHNHNSSSYPYLAPEQFLGRMNKESDQYALGCIAYELLTGQVPFIATSYVGFKEKHTAEQVIVPTQRNLLLPVSCEEVILKALKKKSDDRYPAIKNFVTALQSSIPVQPRGVKASQSAALVTTIPPWLVTQKRNADIQHIDMPQKEQRSYLSPNQEATSLSVPAAQSHLKEEDFARPQADENGSAPQDTRVFLPGGDYTPQRTPIVNSTVEHGAPFLADSSARVASIVAPMYRDKYVGHAQLKNTTRLVWAIVLGLLVVLLGITSGLLFFTVPSAHSPQSSPTATAQKDIATVAPTPTTAPIPTATTKPTPPPALKAAPILVPSPTATPSPIPIVTLIVTPSSFQLSQDCFNQGNHFICTANLLLPQNYHGNLAWSVSGSGASFNPQGGTLSPGQQQMVYIFISDNCPGSGSLSFSTKNGTTTIPWSC